MVRKKGNWRLFNLVERKTLNARKHSILGTSPSDIRKRIGTYNQKEYALIPQKYDTTKEMKAYLRKARRGKANLKGK